MSSILKALKKLEHEKAVQKPGAFRIDADILRSGSTRRSFSTGVLLTGMLIFACGVAATYLFMKHDPTSAPSQQSQASRPEVNSESSSGATTVVPVTVTPLAAPNQRSAEQQSRPLNLISEKPQSLVQSLEKQPRSPQPRPSELLPQTMLIESKPAISAVPPSAAPLKIAVLKVDGIAFQDGTAEGVAVVNGVAVSKGSEIEGARVEEIQKDRVRFSRGAEKFEIILDKSN